MTSHLKYSKDITETKESLEAHLERISLNFLEELKEILESKYCQLIETEKLALAYSIKTDLEEILNKEKESIFVQNLENYGKRKRN